MYVRRCDGVVSVTGHTWLACLAAAAWCAAWVPCGQHAVSAVGTATSGLGLRRRGGRLALHALEAWHVRRRRCRMQRLRYTAQRRRCAQELHKEEEGAEAKKAKQKAKRTAKKVEKKTKRKDVRPAPAARSVLVVRARAAC